ncbi:hypothetical protein Unana1_05268 [Umbelopsis nana]
MADTTHPLVETGKDTDGCAERDPDNLLTPSCVPNDRRNRRFSTSALPSKGAKQRQPQAKRASGDFVRRVSFNTMTHQDMPDYSFTLREKSNGWERSRTTRVFMLATDLESHSNDALKYTVEELLDDGDEIVVVRVADVQAHRYILSNSGHLLQEQAVRARQLAEQLMERIKESQKGRKISIVLEFVLGRTQNCLQDMLQMYQPSALIVGAHGKSSLKTMFPGNNISQFCLRNAPVPVIVVKEANLLSRYSSSNSSSEETTNGNKNYTFTASNWIRRLSLTNRTPK